jgi:hypothetical protein
MFKRLFSLVAFASLALTAPSAWADAYSDTIDVFKKGRPERPDVRQRYGYAVFPTVGKGGLVVGAAHGDGRVYEKGRYIGDTSLTQLSVGFQAGRPGVQRDHLLRERGGAQVVHQRQLRVRRRRLAIAITASGDAKAGTQGASAGASVTKEQAATAGKYYKGMAVYTVAKGGLMFEAALAGQKFNYKPRK